MLARAGVAILALVAALLMWWRASLSYRLLNRSPWIQFGIGLAVVLAMFGALFSQVVLLRKFSPQDAVGPTFDALAISEPLGLVCLLFYRMFRERAKARATGRLVEKNL